MDANPDGPAEMAGNLLNQARISGNGPLRQKYLRKAQQVIAQIDPHANPEALQELQAQVLALQGRGGDTEVAHVTPGEVVIPKRMRTPELMAALARATQYAKERVVFGRPIGKNQAIQHPLAESWMQLEAANLLTFKAAWLYDNGKECGAEANSAKYLGARAAYDACERAILTHGGYGYAKEFHVERFLREVMIARIAPVSEQLVLCYVAERVLGLPKSY